MSNFTTVSGSYNFNNIVLNDTTSLLLFGPAGNTENVGIGASSTGGKFHAKFNTGSVDILSGTGGINLDATLGNSTTTGSVSGPINLISKAASSWSNTSSNLTIQTVTAGDTIINSAEDVIINSTTGTFIDSNGPVTVGAVNSTSITVGSLTSATTIGGDLNVTGDATFSSNLEFTNTTAETDSGSWISGAYNPGTIASAGALTLAGGFGVSSNIIASASGTTIGQPVIQAIQNDSASGEPVVSILQANSSGELMTFSGLSTTSGLSTSITSTLIAGNGNVNLNSATIEAFMKISVTDNSVGAYKVTSKTYYLPLYTIS